jgi:hypothetical protein
MSVFRDAVADLLRGAFDDVDGDGRDDAITDVFAALKDVVGEDAFAAANPVGTVLVTVEGGIAQADVVPAGVCVRIVDIDTDTTEPDEIVSDNTYPGPVGNAWGLSAIDERIERLTGGARA